MPAAPPASGMAEVPARDHQTVAAEKQLHIVCDNYAMHKHELVHRWLKRRERFHVHFTPTSASWLDTVERSSAT